ncbi:hypothetical protein GCM10027447_37370 [Glycomyces halotolerans]
MELVSAKAGPPRHWGTGPEDERRPCPGAPFASDPAERWFRAVTVEAPAATVYRWLCQMKVAPYSYDLLDNRGRRSPRRLTPGAADLELGQEFMTIFTLVDFRPGRHIVLKLTSPRALRLFGPFVVAYETEPITADRTRLLATLLVGDGAARSPAETARRRALAWGDLAMMRKQLLTFKSLAEASGGSASV